MRCYGIVRENPRRLECPHNKSGRDVKRCQGDLMLCSDCEHVRFPPHPDTSTETDVPDPQVAPGTSTPGSGSNKKVTLSSLLISDDVCKLFCDSIDQIFRYAYRDINDTLLKLQKDDLLKIHKELVPRFVSIFPTYICIPINNPRTDKLKDSGVRHIPYWLQTAPEWSVKRQNIQWQRYL